MSDWIECLLIEGENCTVKGSRRWNGACNVSVSNDLDVSGGLGGDLQGDNTFRGSESDSGCSW